MVSEHDAIVIINLREYCLNPYYAGIWSRSVLGVECNRVSLKRLNPYYAGIWSRRLSKTALTDNRDSLNPYYAGIWSRRVPIFKRF